ncbi:helix-turn-helix transcriptional regulator [Nonomuraea diastatica]|uniref:HTH luxR-type domain-containing protein n=1 Tax=Nonomuraea diastatica TaxID=1848329 RepID=A0A4R4WN62_9ACTN|nr:LuxR C-terminal-related transcriptional regulator [Nonomuraea diastatica]TDD18294.1 hypothetical protein E1294_24785 [Nonomuraea diastatica]
MTLRSEFGREGNVWLMPGGSLLSAALAAALVVVGWDVVQLASEEALARAAKEIGPTGRLVLIADTQGRLPDPRAALAGRPRPFVVAVGAGGAFSTLADVVERRVAAAVLDADRPFADLVAALDSLLRSTPVAHDANRLVARLRQREDEARRFFGLTPREQHVLGALIAGRSAAEIAVANQVSMPTVRSHIRAVLTKLGVSSQLAAVALAHRSCREPTLLERMREVHQL